MNYCIAITTHQKRLEWFKKALESYRSQTNVPIFVSVNGNYDSPMSEDYRMAVLAECVKYSSVYPSFYGTFRGLAKIWNDQICHSGFEDVMISNDDITILPGFVNEFVEMFSLQTPRRLLKTNGSFSIFLANKQWMDQCGWFDEQHYLGIGWEDTEFVHRCGEYPSFDTDKYVNETLKTTGDLGPKSVSNKYSVWNRNWFDSKGATKGVNFRPFERFYMDHYTTFWNV